MFLFRREKTKNKGNEAPARDKLAAVFARCIVRVQSKWAAWMQRQSERLTGRGKKTVLVLCCLLAAGYSATVIIKEISKEKPVDMDMEIAPIRVPPEIKDMQTHRQDTQVMERIRLLRTYLNSLATTPAGRKKADSLMKARPGLIDSLYYVEKIYRSQSK